MGNTSGGLKMQTIQTIKEVPIKDIIAKQDFMMRDSLDKGLVAEYKENLEIILKEAPIQLYETPSGLYLTDGFHRLAAARQLNQDVITATIRQGSVSDAYASACLANIKHGKPLTRTERQKAIKEYIKINQEKSDRLIAEEIGISYTSVGKYRTTLLLDGEISTNNKRMGRDGVVQSVGVNNLTPTASLAEQWVEYFNHHVIKDDSFEVLPKLGNKFDLIIVDPPYGITDEPWDLSDKYQLLTFTRKWLNQVLELLKPSGRLFVFWSRKYMFDLKPLFDEISTTYPLEFGGMIVWHFRNVGSMPDNQKRYKLAWEPIFYYYGIDAPNLERTPTEISGEEWTAQWDVWTYAIPQSNFGDKRLHPTQKPLELYKYIINSASQVGDNILDPFAGSGTTGHAALLTGRDFLLIEQKEEYVKIIEERIRPVWSQGREKK